MVQIQFGAGSHDLEGLSIIEVPSDAMAFIRDEVFPRFADRVGELPTL